MAKYDVTFACGHTATVELFGKSSDREWKLKRMAEGICPDCYKAQKEADRKAASEAAAKEAREQGFAELKGSEKQIAWAETIRAKFMEQLGELLEKMHQQDQHARIKAGWNDEQKARHDMVFRLVDAMGRAYARIDSARDIIDNRGIDPISAMKKAVGLIKDVKEGHATLDGIRRIFGAVVAATVEEYLKAEGAPEVEDEEPEDVAVEPTEKKHATLATVSVGTNDEGRPVVHVTSDKDADLIEVVKAHGYRWNGSAHRWYFPVGIKDGAAADRAAEIVNALLTAGFPVRMPKDIKDKAISGTFDPRATRWVSALTTDPDHVYLSWPRVDNDELRDATRGLPSLTYMGETHEWRVPVAAYAEVRDFARLYGFKLTAGAEKNLTGYEKRVTIAAPAAPVEKEKASPERELNEILASSTDVLDDLKDE